MSLSTADVVIAGAGIAGISAAYHLGARGMDDIVLVDPLPPLSLTSDKSIECYRNWWPGPGNAMVALMNRSIDLLEAFADRSGNVFHLNRRGYLYASADPQRIPQFKALAEEAQALGAGPFRWHDGRSGEDAYVPAEMDGYRSPLDGADLITDTSLIRAHFPFLTEKTLAVVHARRCGWFSAQQFGAYLLQRAREKGAKLICDRVEGVDLSGEKVSSVRLSSGEAISTGCFINAAGPFLKDVGRFVETDLPVYSELHLKVSFRDLQKVFPRSAPLLIWADPQTLPWSREERTDLEEDAEARHLLETFPAGAHVRLEGAGESASVLLHWTYASEIVSPTFPLSFDPLHYEIALRGMATMLPGLTAYFNHLPKPFIDGGYCTRTGENRPLIGPTEVDGAYVLGALSGFGIMASSAAGELLAQHVGGSDLPPYAAAFTLSRYVNSAYQRLRKKLRRFGTVVRKNRFKEMDLGAFRSTKFLHIPFK
jgi:sarcosine oxidase, subunit beta